MAKIELTMIFILGFFAAIAIIYFKIKKCLRRLNPFRNPQQQQQNQQQRRNRNNNNNNNIKFQMGDKPYNNECPICLDEAPQIGFISNCNHLFCGKCISDLFQQNNQRQLNCPCCRRKISQFLALTRDLNDIRKFPIEQQIYIQKIYKYNNLFSTKNKSYIENLRDAPFYLRRIRGILFSQEGIQFIFKALIVSKTCIPTLLYILSPIDLLPEAILGIFGLLDDAVALLIFLVVLANTYRNQMSERDQRNFQLNERRLREQYNLQQQQNQQQQ